MTWTKDRLPENIPGAMSLLTVDVLAWNTLRNCWQKGRFSDLNGKSDPLFKSAGNGGYELKEIPVWMPLPPPPVLESQAARFETRDVTCPGCQATYAITWGLPTWRWWDANASWVLCRHCPALFNRKGEVE